MGFRSLDHFVAWIRALAHMCTGLPKHWLIIGALIVVVLVLMKIAKKQERARVEALFAQRGAALAHAGLGLAPSDAALPPDVASSRALRKDGDVIGRPLRGTWEGGELLVIDHGHLVRTPDGNDGYDEVRNYRTVYAFRLPDHSQGYQQASPWSAQTAGDWLVLCQAGRAVPLTTAELAAQLEQARVFARRTLL